LPIPRPEVLVEIIPNTNRAAVQIDFRSGQI